MLDIQSKDKTALSHALKGYDDNETDLFEKESI